MLTTSGNITYKTLLQEAPAPDQVARTLGYQEKENHHWFVYRIPRFSQYHRDFFTREHAQVYWPTYQCAKVVNGKKVLVETPKILNYVFVLTTHQVVERIQALEDTQPVFTHRQKDEILSYENRWLTVPLAQMHSFMLIAQGYEKEIEFCTPNDQKLEKGDVVQVVDGRLKGVEGILLTEQGRKDGRIFVQVTNGIGVKSMSIPDEHIQVLSFSRNSNHFYYKLQAVEKQLQEALDTRLAGKPLPELTRASLEFFLFRYARLQDLSYVNEAKLTTCQYMALMLLGKTKEATERLETYRALIQSDPKRVRAEKRSDSGKKYMEKWISKLGTNPPPSQ